MSSIPHAAEDVVEVHVAAPIGALGGAEPVVVGALLLVGEDRVGLVELLELLLGWGSSETSGWTWRAFFRNARLMVRWSASRSTPSTS